MSHLKPIAGKLLLGAAVIGALFGGRLLLGRLENYVLARPEVQGTRARLTVNAPDFMPEELFRRVVLEQNRLPERFSAADPAVLAGVYESYRLNPWIATTEFRRGGQTVSRPELKVRHAWPDGIVVDVVYRRPRALVRSGAGYVLIDARGVVLPDAWEDGVFPADQGGLAAGPQGRPGRWRAMVFPESQARALTDRKGDPAGRGFMLIEGVAEPPAPPGARWTSPGLDAALLMLAWLDSADDPADYRHRLRGQVRAIAADREGLQTFVRHSLRLTTPSGGVITWGRPPDPEMEAHIDPPAEKKLERLREVDRELGGLDGKIRSLNLRAGRKEAGVRGVRWVFAAPERVAPPAPKAPTAPTPAAKPAPAATRKPAPTRPTVRPTATIRRPTATTRPGPIGRPRPGAASRPGPTRP
jgi:hypothetical protein